MKIFSIFLENNAGGHFKNDLFSNCCNMREDSSWLKYAAKDDANGKAKSYLFFAK